MKIRYGGTADEARAWIEARGYREIQPRTLESDRVFDRHGELRDSSRLLRLRREGSRAIITYKGPPAPGPHKSREEIEFEVSEEAAAALVFEKLGYEIAFRYEKYRTKFAINQEPGMITLDETPMGIFLELEGPAEWLDATAARLGLRREEYLTQSYSKIYQEYRQAHPGVSPNMIFGQNTSSRTPEKES